MKYFSGPGFTLAFCLAYAVVFVLDQPLFVYYPMEGEFHWSEVGGDMGPAMHWYGLVAVGALVALVVAAAVRTSWLPARIVSWFWLAPVACMAIVGWRLRFFFG